LIAIERRATMKPSAAIAIMGVALWALASAPLLSQPQQVAPIASAPATAPVPAPDVKMAAANTRYRHRLKVDARVCLEFPNDAQVIKCSENYR
jgi:hypothetical protein